MKMHQHGLLSGELKQRFGDQLEWLDRADPAMSVVRGRWYKITKRSMDLSLILLLAPLLAMVLCVCVLLIKLESPTEPLFFTQDRTGKHGRRFKLYKFRTMVSNAEELKVSLMAHNERHWPDFRVAYDPRITRAGRLLRRSGLDELPQIFNVLRGDMSLVGPRPTSFPAETYAIWQTERLDVTPGITGLWQVVGRDGSEFDERSRLDIAYIERRCLSADIQILLRTAALALAHIARRKR